MTACKISLRKGAAAPGSVFEFLKKMNDALLLIKALITGGSSRTQTCGGNFNEMSGQFQSPVTASGNYPHYAHCVWNISVALGQNIRLECVLLH